MGRFGGRVVAALALSVTLALSFALAEDITVTTYYPSPRGVYEELRWGQGAALTADPGVGSAIELRGTGAVYLDFSNDAAIDYDVRLSLVGNDTLEVGGGTIQAGTGGGIEASDLNCTDCVTLGAETTGNYATSSAEGGPATDLTCTDCVALGGETAGNYATSSAEGGPATSIALGTPTLCPSGQYARGITGNGDATGCEGYAVYAP